MTYKNLLRKSSHLGLKISQRIVHVFCQDFTASQASKILKIERKTINGRYNYLREVLVWRQIKEKNTIFDGVVEIDESYFGAKRVRGKRGRGAGGKIKVFGLLKREGKVYTNHGGCISKNTDTYYQMKGGNDEYYEYRLTEKLGLISRCMIGKTL